jgi:glutamate racemase
MQHLPHESIVYFGDTARVPYGTKSRETIKRFALEDARFLISRDVKAIVVACNSVSSNALELLKEKFDVPIVGVIEPGARAACGATRNSKVGVIGTAATVESGAYERAIFSQDPKVDVKSVACPLFVPLAEEGWLDKKISVDIAGEYITPLLKWGMDTLLLGCTHYPLLTKAIASVTGENVVLVDSAESTAKEVSLMLGEMRMLAGESNRTTHQFYLSDLPRNFGDICRRFLGREITPVQTVDLTDEMGANLRS